MKWDCIVPFEELWEQYLRVCKRNAAIVLTASQPFTSALIYSMPELFRYEWIWHKNSATNFPNCNKMPMKKHENVCVFYRKLPTYNPQGLKPLKVPYHDDLTRSGSVDAIAGGSACRPKKQRDRFDRSKTSPGVRVSKVFDRDAGGQSCRSDKKEKKSITKETGGAVGSMTPFKQIVPSNFTNYPTSVLQFPHDKETRLHPTQKPVNLFEYLVRTYSNEDETVLDNCAGSGTTAIACINANRKYIVMERDPDYFASMKDRIEKHEKINRLF